MLAKTYIKIRPEVYIAPHSGFIAGLDSKKSAVIRDVG